MSSDALKKRCGERIIQDMAHVPMGTTLRGEEAVQYLARYVANTVTTLAGADLAAELLEEVRKVLVEDRRAMARALDAGKAITAPREGTVYIKRGRF